MKAPAPGKGPREEPPQGKPQKTVAARDPRAERRANALEREIAVKEEELAGFDARMEAVASDYVALGELAKEKEKLEWEIEQLYIRWEEAAGTL